MKFAVVKFFLHSRQFIFDFANFFRQARPLFVQIHQIVERQINLRRADHSSGRPFGTIAGAEKLRRADAR